MTKAATFALTFISTILVTRIFLYVQPTPSPTILGFRLHHYMYGVALIIIGWLTKNIYLYGIGWGLFIDELTFLLMGGSTHEENYSTVSLTGTVIFSIIVVILRKKLTSSL